MTASPDDRTEEVADAVNSTERKPPARKTPTKKAPAKKTAVTRAPAKAAAEKAAATAEVVSEPVTDAVPTKATAATARTAAAKNSASRTTGARTAGTTARSAGTTARSSAAKTAAATSSTASRPGTTKAASAKTAAAKTAAAKTAAQKAAATKTSTRTAAAKAGAAKTAAAKTAAARTAAAKAAAKAADEAAKAAEDAVARETAPAGAAVSPDAPAQEPSSAEAPVDEKPVEEVPVETLAESTTESPTEAPAGDASTSEATESAQEAEPDSTEQITLGDGESADTDSGEGSDPVGADPSAESAVEAIRIRGLVKSFGDHTAVNGVDLTVPAGSFYGIVGPNGAGKTTTLSIVAGLLRADAGSVTICGIDQAAKPLAAKRVMGVLPDRLRTFDRLTGRQLLFYYGLLRGLASDVIEKRVSDLARAFDLGDALSRVVSDYSAGMTKKIMLAGAMIHSPRVLVLDEPFEAVDPVSSAVILDILRAYVSHGGTVILSSHGMDLVERVCSRVAIIVGGDVLAEGTIDEVRAGQTLEARFVELSGGTGEVEGLEWLHTFSD